jgi:hypothetical protein
MKSKQAIVVATAAPTAISFRLTRPSIRAIPVARFSTWSEKSSAS